MPTGKQEHGGEWMRKNPPALSIPSSVTGLLALFIVVHVTRYFLPPVWNLEMLYTLAFIPARYGAEGADLPGGDVADFTSLITYMLVHGDVMHLTVNSIWMLAFGSAVAKRIGGGRFILFSIMCGVAGALTHLVLHLGDATPVVGASAAISGQMAAALRILFGAGHRVSLGSDTLAAIPLAPLWRTLMNPRLLIFIGIWAAVNLLFGLGYLNFGEGGAGIAWEAHIGGFLAGLFGFGWFDRHHNKPAAGIFLH